MVELLIEVFPILVHEASYFTSQQPFKVNCCLVSTFAFVQVNIYRETKSAAADAMF